MFFLFKDEVTGLYFRLAVHPRILRAKLKLQIKVRNWMKVVCPLGASLHTTQISFLNFNQMNVVLPTVLIIFAMVQ